MNQTALLIVDMQNDYFPNGKWTLSGTEEAATNTARVLQDFRKRGLPVIHVRHEFLTQDAPFFTPDSEGAHIHASLQPHQDEAVILKHQVNCFKETDLHSLLQQQEVTRLVITGAMSHMCIDAAVRAAADLGYANTVLHDACATCDQTFDGVTVAAAQVQASFMAALSFAYADVTSTEEYLART